MEGARWAGPEDAADVSSLAQEAIHELAPLRGGTIWRLQAARRAPLETSVAADLAMGRSEGAVVVGTVDSTVVGYGVSRIETLADGSTLAVVTDLYVTPGARSVGVGAAMMARLIEHASEVGAIGIDSLALPGDRSTKNFFEASGLKARAIVVHRSLGGPTPEPSPDG